GRDGGDPTRLLDIAGADADETDIRRLAAQPGLAPVALMVLAPLRRFIHRRARHDGLPVGVAKAVGVEVAVHAVDHGAVAFARGSVGLWRVRSGDDGPQVRPGKPVV